jgi:arylsulfatase A-like enzyme
MEFSFWRVFRLVFVVFSLYLLGDAFYRWDGFRYYASFSDFIPSVALAMTLWSLIAFFTGLMVFLVLRFFEWISFKLRIKIKLEDLIIFTAIFVFLSGGIWAVKRLNWPHTQVTVQLKQMVLLLILLVATLTTWFLRNKSKRLIDIIQDRITPLVWLSTLWFVLSIPIVVYHTWIKDTGYTSSEETFYSPRMDGGRPNFILITFDALTAQNMSVYGYSRPTTPFIKEWAKSASLFMRAYSESNITTPTVTSLMTGKRLWTHQTYHVEYGVKPLKSEVENLPLLLKKNGYYNMAFIQNGLASVKLLDIHNSFDVAPLPSELTSPTSLIGIIDNLLMRIFGYKIRLHDWIIKEDFILDRLTRGISGDISKTTYPPEKVFNRFLNVLDGNPPEPFFAWLHIYPPHYPYLPPQPYKGLFDSSPRLTTFKTQRRAWHSTFDYRFKYKKFPEDIRPIADTLMSRYDEFIRYCDEQFESFIKELAKRDRLKNTVIILSADHGESFSHAFIGHAGPYLYEQMTHIPLIIKEPNQMRGRIIDDLVEQIDIPATILDLAGIPIPPWMEGRSLVPLMRGRRLPPVPIFSMSLEGQATRGHEITKGTFAVWEGEYKLIHYLDRDESLLFNLKEDPDELHNIFNEEPDISRRLLSLIKLNLKKANEKILGYKG